MLNYYVSLLGKVNLMELLNLTLLKVKLFFFENNSVTHQRIMIKRIIIQQIPIILLTT